MEELNILIVDDEAIIAYDLQAHLEKHGYHTIGQAHSGNSAIEKVQHLNPDLILMDIDLHDDIDGIEVIQLIRRNHDIPVIFITGNGDDCTMKRIKQIKHSGLLIKPILVQDLMHAIKNTSLNKREPKNNKSKKEFPSIEKHSLLIGNML